MSVHLLRAQQQTRLIFDGALTIYEARETRTALATILDDAQSIDVDLAGIAEIDLSGVQLLLTLLREPNLKFLPGSSAAVDNALLLLGLHHMFWPQPSQSEH
jgi:ABC-type transporter Mla MlaB component